MTPTKEALLYTRFPDLYAERDWPTTKTRMCDGFAHGDGWFEIVWRLSARLWALIEALPAAEREQFRAVQVKEKFGRLRFYMRQETEEMTEAISAAEEESGRVCERCGSPEASTAQYRGCISTVCPGCAQVMFPGVQPRAGRPSVPTGGR